MRRSVQVLMSTYNGDRYLCEQIDSILAQDYIHVRLLIRDDGSSDGTVSMLREYEDTNENVEVVAGENLGVVDSFFRLLELADDVDYYAFSDQDDVWKPDKISRAVKLLEDARDDNDKPLLYFSKQEYVDAQLNNIGYSETPQIIGLKNALVQNVAIGCTTIIDHHVRDLVNRHRPKSAIMHDWWIYLVTSAMGRVIYDPEPTMKYRQHANNTLGATASVFERIQRRTKRFLTRNWKNDIFRPRDQAEEFLLCFRRELEPSDHRMIQRFVRSKKGLFTRLFYALWADVQRNRLIDNLILRLMIIMNRY